MFLDNGWLKGVDWEVGLSGDLGQGEIRGINVGMNSNTGCKGWWMHVNTNKLIKLKFGDGDRPNL